MLCHMTTNVRLAELGQRVRARRTAASLSIDAAAEKGEVSPVTWSRVELGRPVRELTYASVERVLGWPPGACRSYLDAGKEPPKTVMGKAHFTSSATLQASGTVLSQREARQQHLALALVEAEKALASATEEELEEFEEKYGALIRGFRRRLREKREQRRDAS